MSKQRTKYCQLKKLDTTVVYNTYTQPNFTESKLLHINIFNRYRILKI